MIGRIFKKRIFWIIFSIVILIVIIILLSERIDKTFLIIEEVKVDSPNDIIPIEDSLVAPIIYHEVSALEKMDLETRKKRFVDVMLPAILVVRHNLRQTSQRVGILLNKKRYRIEWTKEDSLFYNEQTNKYKTADLKEIQLRLDTHPVSIVLAQAALESGWGTSRFFEDANNVFGVWSFDPNENRIMASQARSGKAIYLKKYDNIMGSVDDYFRILATGTVYDDFREVRNHSDNVFELIWYLKNYSEKRNEYVVMLRNVIVANDLVKYDHYQIDPDYFDYPPDKNALF